MVVEAHGVGYKIFVSKRAQLPKLNSPIKLFTYLYIREDTSELYGFATAEELGFFETFVSVSGIGPKLALGLLSVASPSRLAMAIKRGDAELLTRSSGIGKRMAERLIVELKDKIKSYETEGRETIEVDRDILEALVALGYRGREARAAIEKINPKLKSLAERLKDALRKIK